MIQNFIQFITEQKNTHMTHVEDSVIYGGANGTRQAINALRGMRDMLGGKHAGTVSVKWDGAPAVFAGTDPSDGRFFVAKKGIFNKNPKVYKTPQEVEDDTSGDLADKLKAALKYLPELGIKGVLQGDLMFGPGDVKVETIDTKKYVTFHPNTILYAVPYEQAKAVRQAKIGIVWHTSYTGSSFETMKASFNADASSLKKSKNVWYQDSNLKNLERATLSKKETEQVNQHLSQIGKLFNNISGTTLRQLEGHPELTQTIETFSNTFVRKGEIMKSPAAHTTALIRYIKTKYKKEIDKRKSEKGKKAQRDKLSSILTFFSDENKISLIKLFELQRLIVVVKLILIKKLNSLSSIDTFVRTKDGYKVTGDEGYVAIDKMSGGALKLVDRMQFSYANFSPDIIKGWESASRN